MYIMGKSVHTLTHDVHILNPLIIKDYSTYIIRTKGGEYGMKTAEEIIAYLAAELAEAYELHDMAKGKDAQEAFIQLLRATTILHILEEIK